MSVYMGIKNKLKQAFAPEEWAARGEQEQASPNCMGGGA